MKTIDEIKALLRPFKSEFESLIQGEGGDGNFNDTGLTIEYVKSFREDATYSHIFHISEGEGALRLFRVDGSYDSWSGTEFYDGLLDPFYEVKAVKVVKTEYHSI